MKSYKSFQHRCLDPKRQDPLKAMGDPLAIDAIDYIEHIVGNARQAVNYYCHTFGFTPWAYCGPETGRKDLVSYVLKQQEITLVLTTPLRMQHYFTGRLLVHGDYVHSLSLKVPDCESFYYEALRRGAQSYEVPTEYEDNQGVVRRAAIKTYGDVIHAIIEREDYKGVFWPGFASYTEVFGSFTTNEDFGLHMVDHMVGNVELGKMDYWVNFYEKALGFTQMQHFSDDQISTEYSALMSKVMRNGSGKIKFPINEPAKGKRKSQIEEYLDFNNGPGVQHIALLTKDILSTVRKMRERGVSFLQVPKTYYEEVPTRVGKIKEDLKQIAELGILVDRDDDGYLLQLFTKPVQDRPTLFFEIIQREGSQGFGVGNFKALFEAIEREQDRRGNL